MSLGINGESRVLSPGCLAICGSHDIHHYRKLMDNSRHLMVIFRPELAGYPGIWPTGRQVASHFWPAEAVAPLVPLLRALVAEAPISDEFGSRVARGLVTQLGGLMDRHLTVPLDPAQEASRLNWRDRMGQAIEFIRSNSGKDLHLKDVATAVNMSCCYFSRVFTDSTGRNFTTYLSGVRLEQADTLLLGKDRSMVDIALTCGFGSVRSFNRAWKELRGGTPRDMSGRARDGKGA